MLRMYFKHHSWKSEEGVHSFHRYNKNFCARRRLVYTRSRNPVLFASSIIGRRRRRCRYCHERVLVIW